VPASKPHDSALLIDAYLGALTRANTRKGSPERSAVDRVTYEKRKAKHSKLTAREALGHQRPGTVLPTISIIALDANDSPRFVVLDSVSRRDAARAGRYQHLVRSLTEGKMHPEAFRRRVSKWRPIAGHQLVADPSAILALVEERRASGAPLFVYESGRA